MGKMSNNCLICGRSAKSFPNSTGDINIFNCPSCGEFGIEGRIQSVLLHEGNDQLFILSTLLSELHVRNGPKILLASWEGGVIDGMIRKDYHSLINNFPSSALELLERSLLNLSFKFKHPADKFLIEEDIKELFFSKDKDQLLYVVNQLAKLDYITGIEGLKNFIHIESKGWEKIEELRRKPAGLKSQAFVAMWFDKSTEEIFEKGIRPAIENGNIFKAVRVDLIEHNNKICDQIIAEIKKSKFVVADFSGNRGGVYFEAGYAQGLGIPVIWIVQETFINGLHFDTRQYNHIVYTSFEDLYKKLEARIEATIY